jgi:hypothetical protein
METALQTLVNNILDDYSALCQIMDEWNGPDPQAALDARTDTLVAHLNEMKAINVPHVEVPMRVVAMVDREENPDEFLVALVKTFDRVWGEAHLARGLLGDLQSHVAHLTSNNTNGSIQSTGNGNSPPTN